MPASEGLSDGFRCILCSPNDDGTYIKKKSIPAHVKSTSHRNAAATHEAQRARLAAINSELQKHESRTTRNRFPVRIRPLDNLPIPELDIHEPAFGAVEERMRDEFRRDPDAVRFAAGEDPKEASALAERRFRQQVKDFGLWNARATARDLGFGDAEEDNPVLYENDDEEQLLSDMLNELCKSRNSLIGQYNIIDANKPS